MLFVTTAVKPPTDITSSLTAAGQTGAIFSYTIISSGGTTPITFNANPLPWSFALENGFLTVTVPRNPAATNLTWGAESSADLTGWNASDTTILQNTAGFFIVRDHFPIATNAHRFLRVKISDL